MKIRIRWEVNLSSCFLGPMAIILPNEVDVIEMTHRFLRKGMYMDCCTKLLCIIYCELWSFTNNFRNHIRIIQFAPTFPIKPMTHQNTAKPAMLIGLKYIE